jgi:hypothetical protein
MIPVVEPAIATAVFPETHVPPDVMLPNVMVRPWHTLDSPEIVPGNGLTVTFMVTVQPMPVVYDIVVLLTKLPVTMPLAEPTDAIEELLLLHVPPLTVLPKVVVLPRQTADEPDIADGNALTVTTLIAAQPVGRI